MMASLTSHVYWRGHFDLKSKVGSISFLHLLTIVFFVPLSCFVPWHSGLFYFHPGMPHLDISTLLRGHLVWGWPQEQISSYRPSLTIAHFVPINFLSSDTQCQWHLVNWEGPWPVQLSPQDFTQLVPGGQDVPGPSIAGICHFVFCICYFVFVTLCFVFCILYLSFCIYHFVICIFQLRSSVCN